MELGGVLPAGEGAGEVAVGLAGEDRGAAGADGAEGEERGLVLVGRQGCGGALGSEVREVVPADGGRAGERQARGELRERGGEARNRGVRDHDVARGEHRVLREEARQLAGVLGEGAEAAAGVRQVDQHPRVGVVVGAEADRAHGDPGVARGARHLERETGVLRVGGVGEDDKVPDGRVRGAQRGERGGHRRLDVDAAAHRLDGEDPLALGARGRGALHRNDEVRGGVDRPDGDAVVVREHVEHLGRGLVRQVHLRAAAVDGHRHRAGAVERDGDRHRELAVLAPELERDGEDVLDGRLVPAAGPERVASAREREAAARVAHPGGDVREPDRTEVVGAAVLDEDARPRRERRGREVELGRRARLQRHPRAAQQSRKAGLLRRRHDEQRPGPLARDEEPRGVVLRDGIGQLKG